jgi:hypothetical protein
MQIIIHNAQKKNIGPTKAGYCEAQGGLASVISLAMHETTLVASSSVPNTHPAVLAQKTTLLIVTLGRSILNSMESP